MARELSLRLVPVMVDYVPPKQIPPELADVHILDMTRLPLSVAAETIAGKVAGLLGITPDSADASHSAQHLDGLIIDCLRAEQAQILDVKTLMPITHTAIERHAVHELDNAAFSRIMELASRAGWVILAVPKACNLPNVFLLAGSIASRVGTGRLTIAQSVSCPISLACMAGTVRAKYCRLPD